MRSHTRAAGRCGAAAARRSMPVASFSRPVRWAPTGCWRAAGTAVPCRALRAPRLLGSAPTARSIVAVTAPDDARDFTASVADQLSASTRIPTPHIESVTYGSGGGAMETTLSTALVGDGTRVTRPLRWLAAIARYPRASRACSPRPTGRGGTLIVLAMQTVDTALRFRPRPRRSVAACGSRPSRTPRIPTPRSIPS